jgi:hypothetical protein
MIRTVRSKASKAPEDNYTEAVCDVCKAPIEGSRVRGVRGDEVFKEGRPARGRGRLRRADGPRREPAPPQAHLDGPTGVPGVPGEGIRMTLLDRLRRRLGLHVHEFGMWQDWRGEFVRRSIRDPSRTVEFARRWQEPRCAGCGKVEQRRLDW